MVYVFLFHSQNIWMRRFCGYFGYWNRIVDEICIRELRTPHAMCQPLIWRGTKFFPLLLPAPSFCSALLRSTYPADCKTITLHTRVLFVSREIAASLSQWMRLAIPVSLFVMTAGINYFHGTNIAPSAS